MILLSVGFGCGVLLSILFGFFFLAQKASGSSELRESDIPSATTYKLTDPIIGVSASGQDSTDYADLQSSIDHYIAHQENNGLTSASVYFSDILKSERFVENPTTLYNPASLMKVPLMMSYYYIAQNNPSVLKQKLYYSGTPDLDANEQVESPVQLAPGQEYTVEQLIDRMIRYSDNNAMQLLYNNLSTINEYHVFTDLYSNLGVDFGSPAQATDFLNVQSYSLFLRVLYNATYLDRDYSEKALNLMTQSDFTEGIETGVPNGITIAQKFDDGRIADANGTIIGHELHNCGIIYYPSHPYILCVMTKGDSLSELESVISGISRITFQYLESRYPSETR